MQPKPKNNWSLQFCPINLIRSTNCQRNNLTMFFFWIFISFSILSLRNKWLRNSAHLWKKSEPKSRKRTKLLNQFSITWNYAIIYILDKWLLCTSISPTRIWKTFAEIKMYGWKIEMQLGVPTSLCWKRWIIEGLVLVFFVIIKKTADYCWRNIRVWYFNTLNQLKEVKEKSTLKPNQN